MNARFSVCAFPIKVVRFTSGMRGKGRSEPLDIGSVGGCRRPSQRAGLGGVTQDLLAGSARWSPPRA